MGATKIHMNYEFFAKLLKANVLSDWTLLTVGKNVAPFSIPIYHFFVIAADDCSTRVG